MVAWYGDNVSLLVCLGRNSSKR